jgi:methylglutaconyl-CoA hydratase
MTAIPFVLAEADPRGIATITLNRPDKANSYDYGMLEQVARDFERFAAEEKIRAIVLRGAGKHFSAGADVAAGAEPQRPGSPGIYEICELIDHAPRPTVAVVSGACVGGGMALAACCDIVIAERTAFFSVPEVRLGITPGTLSLVFVQAMGLRNFRRYAQTGQRFSAEEAHRIGLVHELCEAGALERALAAQLEQILLAAPNAARGAKAIAERLAAGAVPPGLAAQLQAEFLESQCSDEAREGKASFREKRKPGWVPS